MLEQLTRCRWRLVATCSLLTVLTSSAAGWAQNTFPFPVSGNVGIGTTAPATSLDVRGPIQGSSFQVNSNSAGTVPTIDFGLDIRWNYSNGAGEVDFFAHKDGGSLGGYRWYSWNGTVAVPLVSLLQNSNLGVGTMEPTSLLHVKLRAAASGV